MRKAPCSRERRVHCMDTRGGLVPDSRFVWIGKLWNGIAMVAGVDPTTLGRCLKTTAPSILASPTPGWSLSGTRCYIGYL